MCERCKRGQCEDCQTLGLQCRCCRDLQDEPDDEEDE